MYFTTSHPGGADRSTCLGFRKLSQHARSPDSTSADFVSDRESSSWIIVSRYNIVDQPVLCLRDKHLVSCTAKEWGGCYSVVHQLARHILAYLSHKSLLLQERRPSSLCNTPVNLSATIDLGHFIHMTLVRPGTLLRSCLSSESGYCQDFP
jgi:hypothetical protein